MTDESRDVEAERRARHARGRAFKVALPGEALMKIQAGVVRSTYKGVKFMKNPFDRVMYLELIEALKPRTIIECGSFHGGSALWFRDQCRNLGLDTDIVCLDIVQPRIETGDGIAFFQVDILQAEASFPHDIIAAAPHPWIVIEDSAHIYETTMASLTYFADRLEPGDYMVVEDGNVADFPPVKFRKFDDGPNRATQEFLETRDDYEIDPELCDRFGHNVTYCPNGWMRKIR